MKVAVGIFLVIFLTLQRGSHGMFTPLEIDNHPCQPENLKVLPFFVISEAIAFRIFLFNRYYMFYYYLITYYHLDEITYLLLWTLLNNLIHMLFVNIL